jgi:23S rRNA (uracil1939-C5)-methyltransferase
MIAPPDRRAGSPPREGDLLDLELTDLAYGGRGVGRVQGFVIFVEGGLPGEIVRVRVRRTRRGYAEGTVVSVVRASPDRTLPRCEHYGECGGCDLQHLAMEAQAREKGRQIGAVLTRLAGIEDPPVHETLLPGEPWGYRFRMDFDWNRAPDGRPRLGLHRRGRRAEIFGLRTCHLMPPEAIRIALGVASLAANRRLSARDRKLGRGLLRRLGLLEAQSTGEILIELETGRGDPPELKGLALEIVRRYPRVVGVVRHEVDRAGRAAGESILAGRDHLFAQVDKDRFQVPSGAFFQPNAHGVSVLRQQAMAALGPEPTDAVLELYGGVGLFTMELARRCGTVTAVEGSRAAITAARENLARGGLHGVRLIAQDVGEALPHLLKERTWDGVLVDPPRVGLGAEVARALAESRVGKIAYVACDPATMARDIRILMERGKFVVRSVVPLDLFPQTHHIECVTSLVNARRGEPLPVLPAGGGPPPITGRRGPSSTRIPRAGRD